MANSITLNLAIMNYDFIFIFVCYVNYFSGNLIIYWVLPLPLPNFIQYLDAPSLNRVLWLAKSIFLTSWFTEPADPTNNIYYILIPYVEFHLMVLVLLRLPLKGKIRTIISILLICHYLLYFRI